MAREKRSDRKKGERPAGPRALSASLAVLSGVLVFMTYPNFTGWELFPVQWFSLVPLLWAVRGARPKAAFGWGLLMGTVTNAGGFYWINGMLEDFGHLPLWASVPITGLMAAYQGVIFALWTWGTDLAVRRGRVPLLLAAPIVFVAVETIVPFIFPWYFANGQVRFIPIIQITDLFGVSGLSLLLVAVNVLLFQLLEAAVAGRRLPWRQAAIVGAAFVATLAYGLVRVAQVDAAMEAAPKLRIGIVEANIGIWEKEARSLPPEMQAPTLLHNLILHQRLSAELEAQGVDLLVWPESSYIPIRDVAIKRTDVFGFAVGARGTLIERGPADWVAPATTPPTELGGRALTAVAAASETFAVAVGEGGLALRWDGRTWVADDTGAGRTLRGVWASRPTVPLSKPSPRAWAVGDGGVIVGWKDGAWSLVTGGDGATLRAVASSYDGYAFAVGDGGALWHRQGKEWERFGTVGGGRRLDAAWMSADGALGVAAGQGGAVAVLHKGEGWASSTVPGAPDLHGAWGRDAKGAWVVGDGGFIARYDGDRWTRESSGTTTRLRAVSGDEAGRVFAVGDGGVVLERDRDGDWTRQVSPLTTDLRGVAGVGYILDTNVPRDVRWLYQSPIPLPKVASATGDATVVAEWTADRTLPLADRNAVQRGFRAPVLLGALTYEPDPANPAGRPRLYNTALLIDGQGRVLGRYDKNYLLVFGEYIPFGDVFPVLYDWLPEAGHFEAGETVETFPFAGAQLGVMICYEDIMPGFTSRLADKNPNVIINVTNDAWFGKTPEPWLHLQLAMFRAVENRMWLIRSTNTGVSAFVDAVGRLRHATRLEDAETAVLEVPMLSISSPYRKLGDVLPAASLLALVLFAVHGIATSRRR